VSKIVLFFLVSLVGCGKDNLREFYYNPDTFNEDQLSQLWYSVDLLNEITGCSQTPILVLKESRSKFYKFNGRSELWLSNDLEKNVGGLTTASLFEVDIQILNRTTSIRIVGQEVKELPFDFQSIFMHEFGHSFGLEHSKDDIDIMYESMRIYWDRPEVLARFAEQLRTVGAYCK